MQRLRPGLWMLGWLAASMLCACASRVPDLAMADRRAAAALVAEGCYRCLEDALAAYERLAARRDATEVERRGAFDAAMLLVLRAREIGVPDGAWLERARAWAPQVPVAPGRLAPAVSLEALALVMGDVSGLPNEEREHRARDRRQSWPADGTVPSARTALDARDASDLLGQYLALSIDCEDARARRDTDSGDASSSAIVPLIRFQLATCGGRAGVLRALREADPRWAETQYFEARLEMAAYPAPDLGKAAEAYQDAHDAFPESPAITLALAHARHALSEFNQALPLFDEVVAQAPTHREALLGRVTSLSYLSRHSEAIAAATHLIDLGTYLLGDAYYWRAWNHYHVYALDAAWRDVEQATRLNVSSAVYTLAGVVAYARREHAVAIDRLEQAYRMDRSNCEAVWTDGLVRVDIAAWAPAVDKFAAAAECFKATADAARREIDAAQGSSWSPAVKARRVADAERRVSSAGHRRAQSAFNAASSALRLGDRAAALEYLQVAAADPLLKEKAAALRAAIEKQ